MSQTVKAEVHNAYNGSINDELCLSITSAEREDQAAVSRTECMKMAEGTSSRLYNYNY